jgi:hypothetical protein
MIQGLLKEYRPEAGDLGRQELETYISHEG